MRLSVADPSLRSGTAGLWAFGGGGAGNAGGALRRDAALSASSPPPPRGVYFAHRSAVELFIRYRCNVCALLLVRADSETRPPPVFTCLYPRSTSSTSRKHPHFARNLTHEQPPGHRPPCLSSASTPISPEIAAIRPMRPALGSMMLLLASVEGQPMTTCMLRTSGQLISTYISIQHRLRGNTPGPRRTARRHRRCIQR